MDEFTINELYLYYYNTSKYINDMYKSNKVYYIKIKIDLEEKTFSGSWFWYLPRACEPHVISYKCHEHLSWSISKIIVWMLLSGQEAKVTHMQHTNTGYTPTPMIYIHKHTHTHRVIIMTLLNFPHCMLYANVCC